jgi:hypothetical protein
MSWVPTRTTKEQIEQTPKSVVATGVAPHVVKTVHDDD